MKVVDAAIELIIPDNTSFTVLTTLRELGYDALTQVERADHFILTLADDASTHDAIAQLSRAEVVFNPNKHRLSYAVEGAGAQEPLEYEALVRDLDENNGRLVSLLSGTFGMKTLCGLQRAVGWSLRDDRGPAARWNPTRKLLPTTSW